MKKWYLCCNNEDCINHNILHEISNIKLKYDKRNHEMVPIISNNVCNVCGNFMKLISEESTVKIGNFSVDNFNGLSSDKKQEILLKRYKKTVNKEEIHENRKKVISKGIGYGE